MFLIFSRSTCSSFQAVAEDLDDLQAGLDAAVRLLKTDRHSTKWLNVRLRPLYAANTGVRWIAPRILAGCSSFLVEDTLIIYIYIPSIHKMQFSTQWKLWTASPCKGQNGHVSKLRHLFFHRNCDHLPSAICFSESTRSCTVLGIQPCRCHPSAISSKRCRLIYIVTMVDVDQGLKVKYPLLIWLPFKCEWCPSKIGTIVFVGCTMKFVHDAMNDLPEFKWVKDWW